MLVQSVILLFELKHFGRVPLFKRFCHLLFAALLDDSRVISAGRAWPRSFISIFHRLKFRRLVELELRKKNV